MILEERYIMIYPSFYPSPDEIFSVAATQLSSALRKPYMRAPAISALAVQFCSLGSSSMTFFGDGEFQYWYAQINIYLYMYMYIYTYVLYIYVYIIRGKSGFDRLPLSFGRIHHWKMIPKSFFFFFPEGKGCCFHPWLYLADSLTLATKSSTSSSG